MMEVVLTRLRDFSCKSSSFQRASRGPAAVAECCRGAEGVRKVDIESALAWLRRELTEMRAQDQALIRQMMELHSGIQELKQELSEEEEEEETDEDEEEELAPFWDSGSEGGMSHISWSSGESFHVPFWKMQPVVRVNVASNKLFGRRSSVP